jgi:hypothetical protein
MKKILKLIIFLLFLSPLSVFADFTTQDWLFYKEIILPENLPDKGPLAIELDNEVFSSARSDFGDLRIIEGEENEIPFRLIKIEGQEIAWQGEIINPSSVRPPAEGMNFDPERMLDKNFATYYENDYKIEPKKASFVIDLKRRALTKRLMILSTDPLHTWTSIQIEGSNDLENWEKIRERSSIPFSQRREIAYPESFFRYLRLDFEHTGSLKIHEIEVYSASEIFLLFLGEKGKDYRLYYGNDLAKMPSYKVELSLENAFWGYLSSESINPKGKADYDKDGISNQNDNCPFVFNPDQKDVDEDGLGDACDNCPSFKNPSQLDKNNNKIGDICEDDDKDGIINLLDNCPNYPNKDQKDENKNGIGDGCEDFDNDGVINDKDNCPNNFNPAQEDKDKDKIGNVCDPIDDRWTEKYPWLLWSIIGLIIIIIIFLSYRLFKKIK